MLVNNLAMDMLLGTIFLYEWINANLPEKRKITVRGSNPVAIIEQENTFANVVQDAINTGRATSVTLYDIDKKTKSNLKLFTIARAGKQLVFETESVTPVIVTIRIQGSPQFDPNYELATQRCLPAQDIVIDLPNRSFYIHIADTLTGQQKLTNERS